MAKLRGSQAPAVQNVTPPVRKFSVATVISLVAAASFGIAAYGADNPLHGHVTVTRHQPEEQNKQTGTYMTTLIPADSELFFLAIFPGCMLLTAIPPKDIPELVDARIMKTGKFGQRKIFPGLRFNRWLRNFWMMWSPPADEFQYASKTR